MMIHRQHRLSGIYRFLQNREDHAWKEASVEYQMKLVTVEEIRHLEHTADAAGHSYDAMMELFASKGR